MNHTSKLSGLLALSLIVLVALACSSSEGSSGSSNSNDSTSPAASNSSNEFKIDIAEMRKDDGNGEMSNEVSATFTQAEKKIHAYINWDNPQAGVKIKFVYIAVDAGGAKDVTIKELSMMTESELQNEARGTLKPTKPLPKGSYKVDIYINDKQERTLTFRIV